jgi:hypothetical protein
MFSPFIWIEDDTLDQQTEFLRLPHSTREDDVLDQLGLQLLGGALHQGGAHGPGRNGAHANAQRGEVSGQGQGHPQNGGFGGTVGHLAGLSFVAGDRRRVDDDPTLTILVRLIPGHGGCGQSGDVERADGVQLQRELEIFDLHGRVVPGQCPAPGATSGDVDDDAKRCTLGGGLNGRRHIGIVVDVAPDGRTTTERCNQSLTGLQRPIEHDHWHSEAMEPTDSGRAESPGTSRHDC